MFQSSDFADFKVNGKTPDPPIKVKVRVTKIGSSQFELIQPVEGEPMFKEFLQSHGEGVQHIAFSVDDLEEETAKLVEKGIPVISRVKTQTGGAFAYFDTRRVGNAILELIQQAK